MISNNKKKSTKMKLTIMKKQMNWKWIHQNNIKIIMQARSLMKFQSNKEDQNSSLKDLQKSRQTLQIPSKKKTKFKWREQFHPHSLLKALCSTELTTEALSIPTELSLTASMTAKAKGQALSLTELAGVLRLRNSQTLI